MTKREIPIEDIDSEVSGNGNGMNDHMTDEELKSFDRDADFSVFDGEHSGESRASGEGSSEPQDSDSNRVIQLEKEVKELHDRYLRALADCENVKKRATKERSDILRYQGEQIFIDLLSVLDNFDRALDSTSSAELSEEAKSIREGMLLIHRLLTQVFEKWQVKGESAVGKPFDPKVHEAIGQVPSKDQEPGTVLNELERAFFYKDKLIRFGKVVVSTEG